MKAKLIISKVTTYSEDHLLYETKVGIELKDMPLLYSVWGKTEAESRARAEALIIAMDKYRLSGGAWRSSP